MEYFLSFGLVMGLAAGLSPGPLLTLVIAQSLQHRCFWMASNDSEVLRALSTRMPWGYMTALCWLDQCCYEAFALFDFQEFHFKNK